MGYNLTRPYPCHHSTQPPPLPCRSVFGRQQQDFIPFVPAPAWSGVVEMEAGVCVFKQRPPQNINSCNLFRACRTLLCETWRMFVSRELRCRNVYPPRYCVCMFVVVRLSRISLLLFFVMFTTILNAPNRHTHACRYAKICYRIVQHRS